MEYRKATLSDVDKLSLMRVDMLCEEEAHLKAFLDMLYQNTRRYIEDGLNDHTFSAWIAIQNDTIIAMVGAAYFTLPPNDWCPAGKTAYIGNMYTLPAFRNQGIASQLLSLITQEAKENQCQRILLNSSDMGRPLYEKHGFAASPTAMALYPFGIKPDA